MKEKFYGQISPSKLSIHRPELGGAAKWLKAKKNRYPS